MTIRYENNLVVKQPRFHLETYDNVPRIEYGRIEITPDVMTEEEKVIWELFKNTADLRSAVTEAKISQEKFQKTCEDFFSEYAPK